MAVTRSLPSRSSSSTENSFSSRITRGDRNCSRKLSSLKLRIAKSSVVRQSLPAISGAQR
ncbi:hypothetical protein D3C81_1671660 [compost metagenome]